MDRRQKEVQRELLDHEEKILNRLKENYRKALKDVRERIRKMEADPALEKDKIRHTKYQRMLEAQLETILHKLGDENVTDMTAYLDTAYREAYLGCLYGMHGDGVDLILCIDEGKIEKCIYKDTKDLKFSARIYERVDELKEASKSEIARGFSTGKDYAWIARQISLRAGTSLARMYTIARTEGHRVTSESEMDCMQAAKNKGADVAKEWISTLDSVTRQTHVELDGQIRELEEYFVIPSSGAKAMYPGGFGIACEDINCRCCMNQRARWNLDSEEYRYSRAAGEVVSIKSDVYREWKERYTNVISGLRPGKYGKDDGVDPHDPPVYLGKINMSDLAKIDQMLTSFEAENRNAKYEKALVILQDGNVYECYGTAQSVYPDADLGDKIKGSIITHNHPAEYTEYSFSSQDCSLFEGFELQVLRGVDKKYRYELTRLHNEVDELKSIFDIAYSDDEARHEIVKGWAVEKGYGYSRRPADDKGADRAGIP